MTKTILLLYYVDLLWYSCANKHLEDVFVLLVCHALTCDNLAGSIRMAIHSPMGATKAVDMDDQTLQSTTHIHNRKW